nr:MAG TPA: helicase [Caudoviricetes sp.]
MTATDIFNSLRGELADLENKYVINSVVEESNAATGIRELIKNLKETPEIGVHLQGEIFNTVCRGGRKGKLYLRSAGSGVGKTRSMVGDACQIAYPVRYDTKYQKWVYTGEPEKVLYVMTEQDPAEIQTMILAYLTGYNEDMFLYGTYKEEHMDRIMKAIDIMERYKDYMLFARIPDPCASVIKNLFRRYSLQYNVENFFYDYIFSSPAMLNEYRDLKLREDVCLRLLTTAIKNLAVELDAFIMSATQLSGDDDPKGGFKDFRNIRGSKAIADLADFAAIRRRPSPEELQLVADFEKRYNFKPNAITDVFKNRRGRWTMISIWSAVDLGTLRTVDLFVTTPDYKPIQDFQIVNFISVDMNKRREMEEFYNDGVLTDEMADELLANLEAQMPKTVTDSITEAFGDVKETKERLKNLDFDDLL